MNAPHRIDLPPPGPARRPSADLQYDLIVFDWDGTLCDSTGLIVQSIQSACRDVGVPVPSDRDAAYVIGLGLRDALAHVAPGLPEPRYHEMVERYRHHYLGRHHGLLLFPAVRELLERLRQRGHRLAVATGKARRGLDEALAVAGLGSLFDATRTADETASKPDPRMLLELQAQFEVPASRLLMIGDTTHDLLLARNAGSAAVGVAYGAHDPTTFTPYAPRYVARDVADLAAWLEHHG